MVKKLTPRGTLGDVLFRMLSREHCMDEVTIPQGHRLLVGHVLGRADVNVVPASVIVAAVAGNTGNGLIVKDGTSPVQPGAVAGTYRVEITEAASNGGKYQVRDPQGDIIGVGVVGGAAFSEGIKFTLADGAVDFVVGDKFLFTVAGTSASAIALPLSITERPDGSHRVGGMLAADVDTTDGPIKVPMLARGPAVIAYNMLRFGTDFDSDAKKAPAIRALGNLGITGRLAV